MLLSEVGYFMRGETLPFTYLTLNCFNPQIRERVGKFEKFIEENDAKRRRAIQKYQTELKLKTQKNRELDILSTELEQLKTRCALYCNMF